MPLLGTATSHLGPRNSDICHYLSLLCYNSDPAIPTYVITRHYYVGTRNAAFLLTATLTLTDVSELGRRSADACQYLSLPCQNSETGLQTSVITCHYYVATRVTESRHVSLLVTTMSQLGTQPADICH